MMSFFGSVGVIKQTHLFNSARSTLTLEHKCLCADYCPLDCDACMPCLVGGTKEEYSLGQPTIFHGVTTENHNPHLRCSENLKSHGVFMYRAPS